MRMRDAKKLHNGDEVVSKETGESIRVLRSKFLPGPGMVIIEGVGAKTGYREWIHTEVR